MQEHELFYRYSGNMPICHWIHGSNKGFGVPEKRLTWSIFKHLRHVSEIVKNGKRFLNPFHANGFCDTSKNIRKPKAFWCFQGVSKETSGMKWVDQALQGEFKS